MKGYFIYVNLIVILIFGACRKSGIDKPVGTLQNKSIKASQLFYRGSLDYDNSISQTTEDKTRVLLPIKTDDSKLLFKYRITEYSSSGQKLKEGYIGSLVKIEKGFNIFKLPIDHFGFAYDRSAVSTKDKQVNGHRVVAKFKDGNRNIVKSLSDEVLSLLPGCENLPQICIDWYWTSVDAYTGEVVTETFLYTNCYDPCSFTNGGAGTSNEPGCAEIASRLKSATTSSGEGETLVEESTQERTLTYHWKFHEQNYGLWNFKSHETGVHQKMSDGKWQWKTLTHQNITMHGTTLGCQITCTINSAVAQIGLYNAGMQLNYNISGSAICQGNVLPASANYSMNSPVWNVNYTPVQ